MTKVICRFFIVCQSQSQSRYIWEGVVFREITSIRLSFSISLSVCQLIYVLFCKFFNFFPYLLLVNSRCAIRLLPAKARNSWTSFLCCCWFFFHGEYYQPAVTSAEVMSNLPDITKLVGCIYYGLIFLYKYILFWLWWITHESVTGIS